MLTFRQSTASQEIPLGPFVDATDGFTLEAGLTIANTDIQIWKSGAATSVDKNSGGATHDAGGVYIATLDATDTDTLGPMVLTIGVAGARPVRVECQVISAAQYDYLFGTVAPTIVAGLVRADTMALNGLTDPLVRLANFSHTIAFGATHSTTPCTTTTITCENVFATLDPTPTQIDQYKDKFITFTAVGSNGAGIRCVSRRILSSSTTAPIVLTVEAFPEAPGALAVFIIHDGKQVGTPQTGDAYAVANARLPAALTSGGHVKADSLAVGGSTTAADRLAKSGRTIVEGTAAPGSTGTSILTSSLDPAATVIDQFKGRVLIFRSDTSTAALRGQATRITASTALGVLTVEQLTTPPSNDSFVIV